LAALLLGPALGRGYVLTYDMVWVPDLALRPDFLGLASGLPRAVPSDAVVAVLDEVVPGMLLQKLLLLAILVGAGLGADRLVEGGSIPVRLLAIGLFQWNPFVVERLLMGHWPILIGYAVLPWTLLAARSWRAEGRLPRRLLWLVPLGSLSAGAGVVTALVVVAFALDRFRARGVLLLVAAANAPWVSSGLLHASTSLTDASGATAFALSDEGAMPGPVTALGLGGIWNSEVVPDSRNGLVGWLAVALVVALVCSGARSWWRRTERRDRWGYVACWVTGWSLAVATWVAPGAMAWLVEQVPGAGLLRDGSRWLALCAPLLVVTAARGAAVLWHQAPAHLVPRLSAALAVVLAPIAVLPDAAWGVSSRLQAVPYPAAYATARVVVAEIEAEQPGDVLVLPASSYREPAWNAGSKVLDPVGRYLTPDFVASDVLVVSDVVIEGEDPRMQQAVSALEAATPEARAAALGGLGFTVVVVDRQAPGRVPDVAGEQVLESPELSVVRLPSTSSRSVPTSWAVVMGLAWVAFLGLVVAGALVTWVGRWLRRPARADRLRP